ncbi:MAG: Single-stranded-DNA-specific exonuclease RecJ [Chlamydiae bacterium]|nr:Single-stranded-DNA-specific exonuclease RecJ [Chlamydiota bacterium]
MSFLDKTEDLLWVEPKEDLEKSKKLVDEFNVHPTTAKMLVTRGLTKPASVHKFLYSKLPDLLDPYLFPGMDEAVKRITTAIEKDEGILIYGDNDVDGMTGTALLTDFFKTLGAKVHFYVPNRNHLKRSVIIDALNFAIDQEYKIVITVDCSITATDEIEELVRDKVEIIITDHHEPTAKLPHCIATLNPKLLNSTYPNRDITGVGVAFKLAHGVTNHLIANKKLNPKDIDLKMYLDLVALGTVADMGALTGENRILVQYGLKQLKQTPRVGLKKLFDICGICTPEISAGSIASKIAPRMNSLGRIADPRKGVEFLLVNNDSVAEKMAKELDINNLERQKIERILSDEIDDYIATHPEILKEKAIVLASENWHPGIIPIISSRISKQYSRPTIIISIGVDGVAKGSMRTIKEFPLLPILKKNSKLLINFGGHDMASGMTIHKDHIAEFKNSFIAQANKTLKLEDVRSKLFLDAQANFSDLTFDLMDSFTLLEPFGNENPPPILYCHARQAWPPKVINKFHLKLFLEQGDRFLEGIAIGMANRRRDLYKKGLSLKIAFTPQVNYYHNKASIQLFIRDFKIMS